MGIENHEIDDGLTDEERAALAEDDGEEGADGAEDESNEEEGAADEAVGDGEGGDAGADDGAADGDGGGSSGDAAAGDDGAGAAGDAEQPAGTPSASAPILVAEAPTDAQSKLDDIATKKEELIAQFDDGDITAKEYQQQLDALSKQEREIERAVDKAQLASEMEQQRQKNEWFSTVNQFIRSNPVYDPQKNPRLYRALDQEVRDLAVTPEAANWSGDQILAKAHENLTEAFGIAKPKAAEPAKKQAVPKPDLPPNLAKVPAAEGSDTSGGKYAALDRLASSNPIAYEEALMKLSESDRNAYLAA